MNAMRRTGRTELRRRERHLAEHAARIGRVVAEAFLVGDAVFGRGNQILCGSDNANDREQTKGNGQVSTIFVTAAENAVQIGVDTLGNVASTATAATALLHVLNNANAQHQRLDNLYDGFGHVCLAFCGHGTAAEITVVLTGLENADVAFATVQHHVLFQHRDALKLLSTAVDACLKHDVDIKTNRNGVKAVIELYGLNPDVRPTDFGAFDAHVGRVFNDLLSVIGQINADVFKAIPNSAGIQNAIGLNADRLLCGARICSNSVF